MKKLILATLIALSSTAFASHETDVYMNNFQCAQNQSLSACIRLAGNQAEIEMKQVLRELGTCVEKSKQNIANPNANLMKEQAAFMKYLGSQEHYLPENGQHLAQSANDARLRLILQRTDALKDSLAFCSER